MELPVWTYKQSTGQMFHFGNEVGIGYSGNTTGLDNPEAQNVHMVGPAPQGFYTIGKPEDHPKLGPLAMPLEPHSSNVMFGRSGFFIHGDNAAMNHTASDGCLIFSHAIRLFISQMVANGDDSLVIVA